MEEYRNYRDEDFIEETLEDYIFNTLRILEINGDEDEEFEMYLRTSVTINEARSQFCHWIEDSGSYDKYASIFERQIQLLSIEERYWFENGHRYEDRDEHVFGDRIDDGEDLSNYKIESKLIPNKDAKVFKSVKNSVVKIVNVCSICLENDSSIGFVHNEIIHVSTCLSCFRMLEEINKVKCPVCNVDIIAAIEVC